MEKSKPEQQDRPEDSPNTKAEKNIDEINNKISKQMEEIKKEQRDASSLVSEKIDLICLESEFADAPNFLKKIAVEFSNRGIRKPVQKLQDPAKRRLLLLQGIHVQIV